MKFEKENEEEVTSEVKPDLSFYANLRNTDLLDFDIIKLCGEINERTIDIATSELMLFSERSLAALHGIYSKILEEKGEKEAEKFLDETYCPHVTLMISTPGGSAYEAMALYDIMSMVKRDCTISTIGYGKVMSAGVLLLASGTKGERKVTPNCRLMIHSIFAGPEGGFKELQTEMDEIRYLQETYVDTLARESKLSKSKIRKMIAGGNSYFSAEEAVQYGIADQIV